MNNHKENCCRLHGCKFGDPDCPVYLGYESQENICHLCDVDMSIKELPKVDVQEFKQRREYARKLRIF